MLREDELEVGGSEMVAESKDVGKGGGGHAEEDVLQVDDEEGCSHDAQELDERETRTCRREYSVQSGEQQSKQVASSKQGKAAKRIAA